MANNVLNECKSPNIETVWQSLDARGEDVHVASSTPNGPSKESRPSPRRSSRRSWFDKPATKYEIAVEGKRRSKGRKSEVEDETLLLTHFTNPPKISFGNLKPGQHKVRTLLIKNPHDYVQTVKVEKFPHKKNFSIELLEFTVEPKETLHFEITWVPEDAGNFREMILFVVDNAYRLQSFVYGTVEAPQKKKVIKRKGLLGSKVQKPFSVLHTPSLANIKKSYSPQKDEKKKSGPGKALVRAKEKVKLTGTKKRKSDEKKEDIENQPPPTQSNGVMPCVDVTDDLDSSKERRRSHRRSSTYVKMPDLGMSPIGLPPGTGKKTGANDILHSTVRSDIDSNTPTANEVAKDDGNSPTAATETELDINDKVLSCPPKTPDNQKLHLQHLTPALVSPNSFLHDSLNLQNGIVDNKENILLTTGDKMVEIDQQKKILSPDTFLKEMNPPTDIKFQLANGNIPSSNGVLNKSIPHEIVIQQLDNVKAGLQKKVSLGNQQNSISRQTDFKQTNARRETFVKKTGQNRNTGSRRETFEKQTGKAGPFVEVPEEITSSPRRTTYTIKPKRKPLHKTSIEIDNNTKKQNDHHIIEKDVITTETVFEENVETVSTTTHTEVVETYTTVTEDFVPTPERSLADHHHQRKTTTKTEISKTIDSNTVTKNITIPTPERSLCGKQLFSPKTGQSVSSNSFNHGDSSFGSPHRLPNSPLAAVVSKRSSMTVTKERPSDALMEQTERRLSTCLFSDKDQQNESIDDDSLEDKKKEVSIILEEDENCLTPMTGLKTPMTTNERQELDTPMREAGISAALFRSFAKPENVTQNNLLAEKYKVIENDINTPLRDLQSSVAVKGGSRHTDVKEDIDISGITSIDTPMRNINSSAVHTGSTTGRRRSFWDKPCDLSITFDSLETPLKNTSTDDKDEEDSPKESCPVTKPSENLESCYDSPKVNKDEKNESFPTTPYHLLPQKPNPDNSRRSTHVVVEPKVINLEKVQKKNLFADEQSTDQLRIENNEGLVDDNNVTSSFDVHLEIDNQMHDSNSQSDDLIEKDSKVEVHSNQALTVSKEEVFTKIKDKNLEVVDEEAIQSSGLFFVSCSPIKEVVRPIRPSVTKATLKRQENRKSSANVIKKTSPKRPLSHGRMPENKRRKTNEDLQELTDEKEVKCENPKRTCAVEKAEVKRVISRPLSLKTETKRTQSANSVGQRKMDQDTKKPMNRQVVKGSLAVQGKVKGPAKGVAQSKLMLVKKTKTALPKHPLPFAAKNMYYDERWMQKQERGFIHWLNFVLTPPDEYQQTKKIKVDAGSICMDNIRNNVKLAPTKEVLSFRAYSERRRLNQLRRSACKLFQSKEVVHVIQKIEVEVESDRLYIRKDRKVHADLGLKQAILDMLLSFNPLWLRIGLETTFGELIILQNNGDVIGLSRFIITRILSNPEIAAEFSHPSVPHLYRDGYAEAISRHLLKKFLILVFFLDHAKCNRLVPQDPCLFCKDAEYKTCKSMLIDFSKDYLAGEGDITRHLGYLGYQTKHTQTPMDEFDYAVTNLATDLKDGVRLARVMEVLSEDHSLTKRLRAPAISRLQKIHNMDVVFEALTKQSVSVDQNGSKVTSRDIVDGHREKTLKLLWALILQYQIGLLLNKEQLKEEIRILERSLKVKNQLAALQRYEQFLCEKKRDSIDPEIFSQNETIFLLLKWCRVVCAFYDIKVENFTVSFGDGRVLCFLLHHYHPSLLPREIINLQTTVTLTDQLDRSNNDSLSGSFNQSPFSGEGDCEMFEQYLANEKENFKILYEKVSELGGIPLMLRSADMSNTIPDEKVVITYVTYLCARLLDIRHESRAARLIQLAWRRHHLTKVQGELVVKQKAVVILQRVVRAFLQKRRHERQETSAITIQTIWRGHRARSLLRQLKWTRDNQKRIEAAMVIKRYFLAFSERKHYQQTKQAILTLQTVFRSFTQRQKYLRITQAVRIIQSKYRAYKMMSKCRTDYLSRRHSCIRIQKWWRAISEQRKLKQENAAIKIQAALKGYCERKHYNQTRKHLIKLQSVVRAQLVRKQYLQQRTAAVRIQLWYRRCLLVLKCQNQFREQKKAIVTIQSCFRRNICFGNYRKTRAAAIAIQTAIRAHQARTQYISTKHAVVFLQTYFRSRLAMKQQQCKYREVKQASLVIQSAWRGHKVRKDISNMHRAAIVIQKKFKGQMARDYYLCLREMVILCQRKWRSVLLDKAEKVMKEKQTKASILIQAWYRGYVQKQRYCKLKSNVTKIQALVRCWQQRKRYDSMKMAALIIQKYWWAMKVGREERSCYLQMKEASVKIQSFYRGHVVRRVVQEEKNAATKIQASYRSYLQRNKYNKMKAAALVIQTLWRTRTIGRKARTKYLTMKNAALKIQSCYREYKTKQRFQTMNVAATKIQSCFRCFQQRKVFQSLRTVVMVCQTLYRAKMDGYKERKRFLEMKMSALTIQRCYREYRIKCEQRRQHEAAVKIQACYKCFRQRRSFKSLKHSVILCQRFYRNHLLGVQIRRKYLKKLNAIIRIQAIIRSWKERKDLERKQKAATLIQAIYRGHKQYQTFQQIKQATVTCQRFYRNHVLGKQIRQEYLKKLIAVVRLQTAIRDWKVRKDLKQKGKAATLIQTVYRGHRHYQSFQQIKQATITCQRFYRNHVLGVQVRQEYLKKLNAIIRLQSAVRSWNVRKDLEQKGKAATLIQAMYRGHRQYHTFQQIKQATITCQRFYRNHVLGLRIRQEYQEKLSAVIRLQSSVRSWNVRKDLIQKQKAAILIQALYRGHRQYQAFQQIKRATIICQRRYRESVLANNCRRQFLIQKGAALTIEDWYYECKQRHIEKHRNQAATIIQSFIRGRKAKLQFVTMKQSVLIIQKHFRAVKCKRVIQQEYLAKQKAALMIQKHYRGNKARNEYVRVVDCVRRIQSAIKGYLHRRRYMQLKSVVIFCQKHYRSKLSARRQRQQYLTVRSAAISIQSFYRNYQCRKRSQLMQKSSVVIQKHVRGFFARRHFSCIKKAVSTIQMKWKATLLQRECQTAFLIGKGAAITIQSWWKAHLARQRYLRLYKNVILMQCMIRTKRQRHKYLAMKSSAVIIQRHFRHYVEAKCTRSKFLAMKEAAIKIQASVRCHQAKVLKSRLRACTIIQSHVKRHLCQRKYNEIRKAVVTLQSYHRGHLARKNFQKKITALVKIQKCVKRCSFANRVKNYLEQRRNSAIKIQSWFRGCWDRHLVRKIRAAVTIQSVIRMRLARQQYLNYVKNVVTVQSCVRMCLACRQLNRMRRENIAAICVQRAYRQYKERQLMEHQRLARQDHLMRFARVTWINLAAVVLQRSYRRHRLLQQAKERLGKIILIQRWIRGRLHRIRYLRFLKGLVVVQRGIKQYLQRRQESAVIIQRRVRLWLVVRKKELKIKAIVRIQALWRGGQVRRRSIGKKIEKIRQRVEQANRSATEEKKLGNRMASALDYLLRFKQLSHILEVLIHLDVATRLSPACCERFVSVNAVQVIYRLIRGCNRSQPHMELIKYSVSILLNLAKYDKTVYEVYNVEGSVESLVELMQIYREKGAIFNSTCMLLGIIGMIDKCRMETRNDKKLAEKIRSIHLLTARKHKIDESRQIRQARLLAAKSFNSSLPVHLPHKKQHKIKPDWVLHKDKMKEIQDPLTAINFVMDSFQLKPK